MAKMPENPARKAPNSEVVVLETPQRPNRANRFAAGKIVSNKDASNSDAIVVAVDSCESVADGRVDSMGRDRQPLGVVSIDSAEHYHWGNDTGTPCDAWRLLFGPGLSVVQERMTAGTAETSHAHVQTEQFFYVLSGLLTIEIGIDAEEDGKRGGDSATSGNGISEFVLGRGEGLHIPAGVFHRVRNATVTSPTTGLPREVEFLVISRPGDSRADRVLDNMDDPTVEADGEGSSATSNRQPPGRGNGRAA